MPIQSRCGVPAGSRAGTVRSQCEPQTSVVHQSDLPHPTTGSYCYFQDHVLRRPSTHNRTVMRHSFERAPFERASFERRRVQKESFEERQLALPGINLRRVRDTLANSNTGVSHKHRFEPLKHATLTKPQRQVIKYASNWEDDHPTYRVPLSPLLPSEKLPSPDRETNKLIMAPHETTVAQPKVRAANSFHARSRRTADPRKVRTHRSLTTPKGKILALQLSTTPVVSILILPKKTPANVLMTAHTAANAHGHWRGVATSVQLPACITLPCHASELDTRLLRVCIFGCRRGMGDFVIPVRSVLERGGIVEVGKKSILDVRGVVGSYSGWSLGIGLGAGMSVYKEVRGCLVRVRRVGGGRADIVLGEWGFGREGSCDIGIAGQVLWFGVEQRDGRVVRLVFEVVKKTLFGGGQVVGEMQVGLQEIGTLREGQLLKVGWWRGGVGVVLLALVESTQTTRLGAGQVLLQLRLTR